MDEPQERDRLQINVSDTAVGNLGRGQVRSDTVFAYAIETQEENAVSLTMPVRLESYSWERGVPPLFEMNLPEGALRDELTRRFSKAVRGFDDFSLLTIVGPHQLGRVGITPEQNVPDRPPETSLADLLIHDGTQGLFDDLMDTYGQYSGVSGVQPKVLMRFGRSACNLTEGRCNELLQLVVHGMDLAMIEMRNHIKANSAFAEVGAGMLDQWEAGVARSLVKG
ncbi:HipA N-terminal domain-containing protein [Pseudomonas sp. OV226]|jgi:serine/threonine-protein kinase HipA|uniref:HipA N-terminal domain-containing protein n=1 Tax=Pseudomonas sp. OV226 TaxID=2135588 RepID=UPI000D6C1334|nr:HipA N-terminal domain-containing protein [Pseudomonas sp. OV226]PWK43646.1 HipA-like protein [Pseudomonas sp. OV226]